MLTIDFSKNTDGLVPVVAQDYKTGEILMQAYANEEAWKYSLETGNATYWSRSRSRLWKKGESSGHIQIIKEILIDCDRDSVVLKVEQIGKAACHKGYRSCFYSKVKGDSLETIGKTVFDPKKVYNKKLTK